MRYLFVFLFCALGQLAFATDTEISIKNAFGTLEGSIRSAGPKAPQVIIVPGSGPIDRNGLPPKNPCVGIYDQWADALKDRGITTLRFDKRGSFGSHTGIGDKNDLRIAGYAEDLRLWIDAWQEASGEPCIWLLGHSEGGLVSLVTAHQNSDRICGLILATSPGRPIDVILKEQIGNFTKSKRVMSQLRKVLDTLKTGGVIDEKKIPLGLRSLFGPVNQRYFADAMAYTPTDYIAGLTLPITILQCARDVQVRETDADALNDANDHADLTILLGHNHSFQETDLVFPLKGTPPGTPFIDAIENAVKAN